MRAALLLLLFPLLPESPHWLAVSGDTAAAEALLRRIAHVNGVAMLPGRLEAASPAPPGPLRGQSPGGEQTPCFHLVQGSRVRGVKVLL